MRENRLRRLIENAELDKKLAYALLWLIRQCKSAGYHLHVKNDGIDPNYAPKKKQSYLLGGSRFYNRMASTRQIDDEPHIQKKGAMRRVNSHENAFAESEGAVPPFPNHVRTSHLQNK